MMPSNWPDAAALLAPLRGMPALIVGDLILDHYLMGRVERISPEAPVPVVVHEREEYRLGGAANVALNMAALGAQPFLLSVLGQDEAGTALLRLLREDGLATEGLVQDPAHVTSLKTRVLARGQQLLRYDRERILWLEESTQHQLLAIAERLIKERDIKVLVFQDYNKGVLPPALIENLIALAQRYAIPTVVDPKREHFLAYCGVTLFKPNLKEVNEGLGLSLSERDADATALETAAQALHQTLGNTYTLITLGARGLYLSGVDFRAHVPTRPRAVADVCGAGDTVVSIVALGLAAGWSPMCLAAMANLAGGQVCESVGTVAVRPEQLATEYEEWRTEQTVRENVKIK